MHKGFYSQIIYSFLGNILYKLSLKVQVIFSFKVSDFIQKESSANKQGNLTLSGHISTIIDYIYFVIEQLIKKIYFLPRPKGCVSRMCI